MTRVHAIDTPAPLNHSRQHRSTHGSKVIVSPAIFIAVWWFVWMMHLVNGTLALAFAVPYHFFSIPIYYTATAVLRIPVIMFQVSAWSYTALALVHWYSLGKMTWRSLRARRLTMGALQGKSSRSKKKRMDRLMELLSWPWRRSFGVNGIVGVNGRYFYVAFFTREVLEIFLQSYQAAQLSLTMRRTWITHLAAIFVLLNCIATPLIHYMLRDKQDSAQRFVHLLADMCLDFCSGVVIPLSVLTPLATVYDASISSFTPALVNDDTWVISTIAEIYQFCITSGPDFFATMLPLIGVYTCLGAAKQLVQRKTTLTTERSERRPWVSIAVVTDSRTASQLDALASRFSFTVGFFSRLYAVSRRHLDRAYHLLLASCVAMVTVYHARAHLDSSTANLVGCRLSVHPWEATKAPCMVMQINCYRHNISGSAAEIATRSRFRPHIVWQCSRAQALWAKVASQWECFNGVATGLQHAIFSWQPPATKIQWAEIVKATTETGATPDERWARLRHWRQIAWRQLCSSVVAHLWFKRVAETHEPTADPPEADWPTVLVRWREALFGTTAHLSSARSDTRDLDLALHRRLCRRLLQDDLQEVSVPISRDARYLLFFDGGSRGNPGPGGSGAVIVTIKPGSHDARLVWVAAMSYASKSTTNNLAEYRGLRTGLQAAADHKWHPLHVIGDSQLILNQMRRRTLPKTASLRHEFLKAQQLCDGLVIAGWHHHYRTYNKMADKAANVAMDECASMQVYAESSRPLISSVQLLMQQDVYQWASAQWSDT